MKQLIKYILPVLAFGTWIPIKGQDASKPDAMNFYEIKKQKDIYFEDLKLKEGPDALKEESSEYNAYLKWCNFWEPRLSPSGDFSNYFNAVKKFEEGRKSTSNQKANVDPWYELGPVQKPPGGQTSIGGGEKGVGVVKFLSIYQPNPDYMLSGSFISGLFYTTNGGTTWTNSGSDTKWGRSSCSAVTFSVNDPNTWYAANASGAADPPWLGTTGGIMRTTDQGATWEQIGDNLDFGWIWAGIYKILADPSDPDVLYVTGTNGIYKTSNATAAATSVTWTQIFSLGECYDIEFKPGSSTNMYATAKSSGLWYVFSSTNSGASWTQMSGQPSNPNNKKLTIEVTPANSNYLYMLFTGGGTSAPFYRYDASAGTWSLRSTSVNSFMGGGNAFAVSYFNADEIYIGDNIYYSKSTNGGQNWSMNTGSNQYHVDLEYIECSPVDQNTVWMTNHGGVNKTINSGSTWTNVSTGLGTADILGMNTSYTDPQYIGLGLNHDGTVLSSGTYANGWTPYWSLIYGGDGFRPVIDYTNPQNIYVSPQYNGWRFSSNYGASTTSTGIPGGEWYSYAEMNTEDPSIIYSNGYMYTNQGNIWRHERNTTNDGYISDFSSAPYNLTGSYTSWRNYNAPSNSDYLYVFVHQNASPGVEYNRVYRTTQASASIPGVRTTWVEITQPMSNYWLADITIDYNDPNIVYYTYSGYQASTSGSMVFKVDYTSSVTSPTITNLSYNLPQTFVSSLALEKGSNGGIYVATDFGVYFINNDLIQSGSYWQVLGTGLPNVFTGDGLEINYQVNKIRIGTAGRGVWEHDLYCPPNYDLTLSGTQTGSDYQEAEHDITSTQLVTSTGNVTYRAGNKIVLSPNFKATSGSYFHAFIHACSHSGNSFRDDDSQSLLSDEAIENFKKDEEEEHEMTIYPNPSNGEFTIELGKEEKAALEIFNIQGERIKSDIISSKYKFSLIGYSRGIYFVKVLLDDKVITKKIILD